MFVMKKGKEGFDRELFFRALADRTRLRIINLIGDQEVCVCFFVEILKTNQPKISRHLAYLRRAGIVAARREGIWMHYRLSTPEDENAARSKSPRQDLLRSGVAGPVTGQSKTRHVAISGIISTLIDVHVIRETRGSN